MPATSGSVTLDRRDLLKGAGAAIALMHVPAPALPAPVSAGEIHMRKMLVATVRHADQMLDWDSYSTLWRVRRAIALEELAEYDRGTGCWRRLARQHVQEIPDSSIVQEETRRFIQQSITQISTLLESPDTSPEAQCGLQQSLQKNLAELAEVERGEGRWLRHKTPYRIVTKGDLFDQA